jgi:pimeloyl-ACP methyl ester carboxylesterase
VKCEGVLDAAPYQILLPENWNGTLLLWSHGYRQAKPAPPDFAPVSTRPDPAPRYAGGNTAIADKLLSEGYALAGSAFATNGWAVADGVKAGEDLYAFFVKEVAKPKRVYVWGESLGGLITEMLAEKHPEWVSGSAPTCGAVAGANLNLDLALDVAYAVKTFFDPGLKLAGFTSWDEAVRHWNAAAKAILAASSDLDNGVPAIVLTAALVDAPDKTRSYDGGSTATRVRGQAESILSALGYATFGRYEFEQRVGGNASDNTKTDYAARLSVAERKTIDGISAGAVDRLLPKLEAGARLAADGGIRAKADELGDPTGDIDVPTLTVHTSSDPLVLVQNETVLRERVAENGKQDLLVQTYTVPPATYAPAQGDSGGAPYGAGHCNFTPDTYQGLITTLDDWVRGGVYPGNAALKKNIGPDSGLSTLFKPGNWPAQTEGVS